MFYLVNISHRIVTLKTVPWKVTCLAVNHFPTLERQRLGREAPIYLLASILKHVTAILL